MKYYDVLYGEWELPPIIEDLCQTKEMNRLRHITQAVAPNNVMPYGFIPSRFHHGMGVCYLIFRVLKNNARHFGHIAPLLLSAALLHDAGNSPFSHLGEHFLKEATGKNGEEFLQDMLEKTETEKVLHKHGVALKDVVALVTGKMRPFSDVLHGSIDGDNLDNIARFHYAALGGKASYDPIAIASSFLWRDNAWALSEQCFWQIKKWQEARERVYKFIYGYPHLAIATMLYRAVELAFTKHQLLESFFRMDDYQALNYLRTCNTRTRTLMDRLFCWHWYEEVFSHKTIMPSEQVKVAASSWKGRRQLTDAICARFPITPEDVCVVITKGREKRSIELPFVYGTKKRFEKAEAWPIYHVRVYVHPNIRSSLKKEIAFFAADAVL